MLKAFSLALGQIGDAAVVRVLIKSVLITLILCIAFGLAVGSAAEWAMLTYAADLGREYYLVFQTIGVLLAVFFGFRLIAIPVIGIFADEIVSAVERRHFPAEAAEARAVGLGLSIQLGLMSALRLVLFNLLALPGYLLLLITGVGPIILFILVNALLLGRDLGEMVAVRHLRADEVRVWLRQTRGPRLVLGLIATGLFMVPLANILAPIIGAAMATHLFHDMRIKARERSL